MVTIYATFYGWRRRSGPINIFCDVVVVRDDTGGSGPQPFSDLTDPRDNKSGMRVVSGVVVPFRNQPTLAFERVGGDLSICVDPRDSSTVFIAWTDNQPNTGYTLHVRNSQDRGITWSNDLRTISNAKNPALSINTDGKIGLLYQQLTQNRRWDTHIEFTNDDFTNVDDLLLVSVPSDVPAMKFLPYNGDYVRLLTVDKTFYGVFSASNAPDLS